MTKKLFAQWNLPDGSPDPAHPEICIGPLDSLSGQPSSYGRLHQVALLFEDPALKLSKLTLTADGHLEDYYVKECREEDRRDHDMELIAWTVYEAGYSYGDVASHCITKNLDSLEDAVLDIFLNELTCRN